MLSLTVLDGVKPYVGSECVNPVQFTVQLRCVHVADKYIFARSENGPLVLNERFLTELY